MKLVNPTLQKGFSRARTNAKVNITISLTYKVQCRTSMHHRCAQRHTEPSRHMVGTSVAAPDAVVDVPSDREEARKANESEMIDWFDAWYPLNYVEDMDKSKLHRLEVLQIPMVIWWDPNASAWRVFEDLCPHRLVPLSEGRINQKGHLECGYHGWEFSGSGKCERIPQEGNINSPRACVTSFPCAVEQGLLWVKPKRLPNPLSMSDAAAVALDTDRIPIVPELEDPSWVSQDTWRDIPYDFTTLLENVMDVSHVPHTHHKSISNRNKIGDFRLKMSEPISKAGFSGTWATGPRAGQLGTQNTFFSAPCYMKHRLEAAEMRGFEALTIVYAVPMSPGRCRLINRNCTRFVKSSIPGAIIKMIPQWFIHTQSHIPLEDDQVFLHVGEPEYLRRRIQGQSTTGAYFLASPADTYVGAFRKWLDRHANGGPFGPPTEEFLAAIGPRWSREQLLDRYSQHTASCATCQKGLKQIQGVKTALLAAMAAFGLLSVFCAAVAVASTTGVAGVSAAAAGTVSAPSGVSGLLLSVGAAVSGSEPAQQIMRAVTWAVLSASSGLLATQAAGLERRFFKGDYPPMRNTAKDP